MRLNEVGSNPKCIKFKSLDKFVWRLHLSFSEDLLRSQNQCTSLVGAGMGLKIMRHNFKELFFK